MKSAIIGSGIYLPHNIKTNTDLERALDLPEGFIESSTGIQERRWCEGKETLEYLASEAALHAVKNSGVEKIDRIIVSRDIILTSRAKSIGLPIIEKLGDAGVDVEGCFSIDIANYCPGAIHAINIAKLMVESGEAQNVLVIAPTHYVDIVNTSAEFNQSFEAGKFDPTSREVLSYSLDPQAKGVFQAPNLNAFLWGNGAGALVVGKPKSDGEVLHYHAKGSRQFKYDIFGIGQDARGKGFGALDGTSIYKFAIKEIPEFIQECLTKWDIKPEQIGSFIPHQPNPRILHALAKKFPTLEDKMEISCATLGNIIGASIPITYHVAKEKGRIKSGDYVFMCSFGDSYLTAAGLLFKQE